MPKAIAGYLHDDGSCLFELAMTCFDGWCWDLHREVERWDSPDLDPVPKVLCKELALNPEGGPLWAIRKLVMRLSANGHDLIARHIEQQYDRCVDLAGRIDDWCNLEPCSDAPISLAEDAARRQGRKVSDIDRAQVLIDHLDTAADIGQMFDVLKESKAAISSSWNAHGASAAADAAPSARDTEGRAVLGLLSASQLAATFGISQKSALKTALSRGRIEHKDGWEELPEPKARGERYVYDPKAEWVLSIISRLKAV